MCVGAAWRVPQLTGFLDTRASMMGVQGQISEVLDQVDRMESLCVDLQQQVGKLLTKRRVSKGASSQYSTIASVY